MAVGSDAVENLTPEVPDDPFDAALRAGYGRDSAIAGDVQGSVLRALGRRVGVPTTILLREIEEDLSPVDKPQTLEREDIPGVTGHYSVFGEISHGGMGAILKGRDVDLGRDVALKVLLNKHAGNEEMVRRFIEEAQIGGQLQHPGIVPLYGLGLFSDGRPYFAMKLVKGRTLGALLEARKAPSEDRHRFLGAFHQICQTMAYAHARGVIHRDLKPSNIMVGAFGEVQVMDWGLAKVLTGKEGAGPSSPSRPSEGRTVIRPLGSGTPVSETQPGMVMGTPAYMPPEQARGKVEDLDERCDVFGLGAILCQILTGQAPYVGAGNTTEESWKDLWRKAEDGDLEEAWARLQTCGAEDELLRIVRKCLAPRLRDRFRDAGLLEGALTSYISSVEERARQAEVAAAEAKVKAEEEAKARKLSTELAIASDRAAAEAKANSALSTSLARRTKILSVTIAASSAFLILGLLIHAHGIQGAKDLALAKKQEAEAALQRETEALLAANDRLRELYVEISDRAMDAGLSRRAAMAAAKALEMKEDPVVRGKLYTARSKGPRGPVWTSRRGIDAKALQFSPDGKHLAGADGSDVALWDARSGNEIGRLKGHRNEVLCLDFSRDGRMLASGSRDQTARIWDMSPGSAKRASLSREASSPKELAELRGHAAGVQAVAFSPDGKQIASGSADKSIRIWDLSTRQEVRLLDGHTSEVFSVLFTADGRNVVSGSADATIRIWERDSGAQTSQLLGHEGAVSCLALGPGENEILTAGADKTIRVWNLPAAKEVRKLEGHAGSILGLALSRQTRLLASGSEDKSIGLWDLATGKKTGSLSVHTLGVQSLAFTPDGGYVASGSRDGTVRIWDSGTQEQVAWLDGHSEAVSSVAFSRDGKRIASVSADWRRSSTGSLRLWDSETGMSLAHFDERWGNFPETAFSADGKRIFVNAEDAIHIHDAGGLQRISTFSGFASRLSSLALSPDDSRLAVCGLSPGKGGRGATLILDSRSGKVVRELGGQWAMPVAFSPDGKQIASTWLDFGVPRIALWDLETGNEVMRFEGHEGPIASLAFSPDGDLLASAPHDRAIRLWKVSTGRELRRLTFFEGYVRSVCFSPDGGVLASSGDGIRLWHTDTGREIARLSDTGYRVAFSPDGKRVVSGSRDGTVSLWDVDFATRQPNLGTSEIWAEQVDFSPDCKHLFAGPGDKTLRAWELSSGEEVERLQWDAGGPGTTAVAVSRDGKRMASSGTRGNEITLWDLATRAVIARIKPHRGTVNEIHFSPDGDYLISRTYTLDETETRLFLWDATKGTLARALEGHSKRPWCVAFNPDPSRARLASSAEDGTVRLWDWKTGKEVRRIEAQSENSGLAFSPDGARLAFAGADYAIRIWDGELTREERRLQGHGLDVYALAWCPGGRYLASLDWNETACVWDLQGGREVARFRRPGGYSFPCFSPDGRWLVTTLAGSGSICVEDMTALLEPKEGILARVEKQIGLVMDSREIRPAFTNHFTWNVRPR